MARIKGNNLTESIRPTVELLSKTENPVGTLFSLWHGSRHENKISAETAELIYRVWNCEDNNYLRDIEYYQGLAKEICAAYPEHAGANGDDVVNVIEQVALLNLKANVPSSESVLFTFSIDGETVALREQMVRSKFASYWTQTSRTADLTAMDVNMSENIEFYGGQEAVDIYKDTVQALRDAYIKLGNLGVPVEDIRLAPESRVHRVYWMITARSLLPIISKRASWIAQASLWSPIIADVNKILREVSSIFTYFIGKNSDCEIADGKVVSYKYDNENDDRVLGRDPQPTDPLYLAYKGMTMPEHTDIVFYDRMKSMFIHLWNDEILEVLGWDRDDVTKIGKYDRPYSWFVANGKEDMIKDLSTPEALYILDK